RGGPRHPRAGGRWRGAPGVLEGDRKSRTKLQVGRPSPLDPPSGCAFHQRCPYAVGRCRVEEPKLRDVDGRLVACHRAEEVGEANA
ncbi:dipeptide ABC transporter ATP-binding protein, partial [Burkholderia pseudomallei]